jgi:nucleoside transporter
MTERVLKIRLCTMMFLEYAIRGMWFPFLASYLSASRQDRGLGFSTGQTGWVLGFANAVGALTAPLVAGQIADRYLNAERALGILHVIAAVLLFCNASSGTFGMFFVYMLCFSVAYVPTQSLTNSLALSHLSDREKSYPRIRMWGTIGWVVTSSLFTYTVMRTGNRASDIARIPYALRGAAVLAIGYAGYAFFFLPPTPPARKYAEAGGQWAIVRALGMLRKRSVLVLTLVAVPAAAIHTAYYLNIAPFLIDVVGVRPRNLGPVIAVSQTSEVVFLFALGPLLRRFGYKNILLLGCGAQALRFLIFAWNPPAGVVICSLTLHGIAYACFFTTAILYIERSSPADIRHSAQTVFGIVLFGVGPALSGPYSEVFNHFTRNGHPDFRVIWYTQFAIATVAALVVLGFFYESASIDKGSGVE